MRSGARYSKLPDGNGFFSNPGDRYQPIYTPGLEDGQIVLVETGKIDVQEAINSYADQTDMSLIMARLAAGDTSVLYQRVPMYGDFSNMPYDSRAMLQNIADAHTYFDNLSDEVRERFGNSFVKWFSSAGAPDWVQKMAPKMPDSTEKPAPAPVVPPTEGTATV